MHHAFLYISLQSQQDNDVKMPNFTFCGEREHKTSTLFFFSLLKLWYSPLEFNPRKIANIWRIQRHGMRAIKFEAARYHILTDVFVAVAVVVS